MGFKKFQEDIASFMARDPAARSGLEVVLCYPGFHALVFYRVSHAAWRRGWYLSGRFISHLGKFFTGIEIHPGAEIGRRLVIDHGTGVVIGETAVVGDNVSLLHGVTLGGTGKAHDDRHPKVGHGVMIGAGAKILGNIRIGSCSRIAAGSVVLKPVPRETTVAGVPAKVVGKAGCVEPSRTMNQLIDEETQGVDPESTS